MDWLRHDLRDAARSFARNPTFTAVVVVTLALGIGANTAIFTLFDQVLLRRLPGVESPERLVTLDGPGAFRGRTENDHTFSYPMFRDFREQSPVFSGVLARYATNLTLVAGDEAERVEAELVSGDYFEVLGAGAATVGRTLSPGDEQTPGGHPVVVLSHGYWTRRFGADPAVVGRSVRINGHPMTVVGVAPAGFASVSLGSSPDLFVPLMMKAQMTPTWDDLDDRRSRWLNVVARLAPGVSVEQADAAMNAIYQRINAMEIEEMADVSERFRRAFLDKRLELLPGTGTLSPLRSSAGAPLAVLMGMVGLVLLIACANVANLLLARAQSRRREAAVRLALGAGRLRVVRQRLVESLLYAASGAAVGLLLALWGGELLRRLLPEQAGPELLSTTPDLRVLLFTLAVTALTAVVFGIGPALSAARPALASLHDDNRSGAGRGAARLRRTLVAAQVALSLVLLAGAGLFARSLFNLSAVDPGFRLGGLTTFSLDPALSGFTDARATALLDDLRREIAALPGVEGVSLAAVPLLADSVWSATVRVDGYEAEEGEDLNPEVNSVSAGFFSTLDVPVVVGRPITEADTDASPRVAVVNQSFARYFFGDASPVGRTFHFGPFEDQPITIVGMVRDTRSSALRDEIRRIVYLSAAQEADLGAWTFYVRAGARAGDVGAAVREAVRRVAPDIPLYDLRTLEAQASRSLLLDRMLAVLSTLFAVLATVLAAVGLYGMTAYSVARRTREIGIRMALGAARPSILWGVLREVALLAGLGLAVGLPAYLALARLVESQLFGLSGTDPVVVAGAGLLLATVSLAAGYPSARRALAVDPMRALRAE
jgi:predicted permease